MAGKSNAVVRPPERTSPPTRAAKVSPYEMIKQAIIGGDFPPGHPLVETSLANWCGVSRTPIREALRRLEQDGLVYRAANGLAVRERSPSEILDLYETRLILEGAAARFAASRRTDHDIRTMQWILQRCRRVEAGDVDAMVEANRGFHTALWKASHNESLIDLLERLRLHLARYPGTTLAAPGRWPEALDEHAAILEAIENRDGERASEIATNHSRSARDIRLAQFAESAEFPLA